MGTVATKKKAEPRPRQRKRPRANTAFSRDLKASDIDQLARLLSDAKALAAKLGKRRVQRLLLVAQVELGSASGAWLEEANRASLARLDPLLADALGRHDPEVPKRGSIKIARDVVRRQVELIRKPTYERGGRDVAHDEDSRADLFLMFWPITVENFPNLRPSFDGIDAHRAAVRQVFIVNDVQDPDVATSMLATQLMIALGVPKATARAIARKH